MLTGEAILGVNDGAATRVEVPEWNGHVYIKNISGTESESLKKVHENDELDDITKISTMLVVGLCDKDGEPLFTEDQVNQLAEKSIKVLVRLVNEFNRINGLSEDTEDTVKNSDSIQKDDSGSK